MFTAAQRIDGNKILFSADGDIWPFHFKTGAIDDEFPKSIDDHWVGGPSRVDAIVRGQGNRKDKLYLFNGFEYWRVDLDTDTVDAGYPRPIFGNWPGLWAGDIDGAVTHPEDNKLYFFRGTDYIRYDFDTGTDAGFPHPIAQDWPGLTGPFDCVMQGAGSRDKKLYFFKDDDYWRWDIPKSALDHGYPKKIEPNWRGLRRLFAMRDADGFGASTAPTHWPNLNRRTLVRELKETLKDPNLIRQRGTPFCGPAALLYVMVKERPREYVDLVRQLFETGQCQMRTKTMEPSLAVQRTTNEKNTRQVDWIAMASMRDAANAI
ncbi:MAG: hemopexin repeat-containing protein, partial [Pseudomonadota bacterium]